VARGLRKCGRGLKACGKWVWPAIKGFLFVDIAAESFIGLGASTFFSWLNNINYLLGNDTRLTKEQSEHPDATLLYPALYFALVTLAFAALTRTPQVKGIFYRRPSKGSTNETSVTCCNGLAAAVLMLPCVISLLSKPIPTYGSISATCTNIKGIWGNQNPDTEFWHVFICLKITSSSLFTWFLMNFLPAMDKSFHIAGITRPKTLVHLGGHKELEIKSGCRKAYEAFGYTVSVINIGTQFFGATFNYTSTVSKVPRVRDIAFFTSEITGYVTGGGNLGLSVINYIPSVHKMFQKEKMPDYIPRSYLGTAYTLGVFECGMTIPTNNFVGTALTISDIKKLHLNYSPHAEGIMTVSGFAAAGAIFMAFAFNLEGTIRRGYPEPEVKNTDHRIRQRLLEAPADSKKDRDPLQQDQHAVTIDAAPLPDALMAADESKGEAVTAVTVYRGTDDGQPLNNPVAEPSETPYEPLGDSVSPGEEVNRLLSQFSRFDPPAIPRRETPSPSSWSPCVIL
jgi:hypothetical protein